MFWPNCNCCGGSPGTGNGQCTRCLNDIAPAEMTVSIAGVTSAALPDGTIPKCATCAADVNGTYVLQATAGGVATDCIWELGALSKCVSCFFPVEGGNIGFDRIKLTLREISLGGGLVQPFLIATFFHNAIGSPSFIQWRKNLTIYPQNDLTQRPNCCTFAALVLPYDTADVFCRVCNGTASTATVTSGAC